MATINLMALQPHKVSRDLSGYITYIYGEGKTGKTTLANNLSEIYKLPVTHIDGIHHMENWKQRDKEERDAMILKIASRR